MEGLEFPSLPLAKSEDISAQYSKPAVKHRFRHYDRSIGPLWTDLSVTRSGTALPAVQHEGDWSIVEQGNLHMRGKDSGFYCCPLCPQIRRDPFV